MLNVSLSDDNSIILALYASMDNEKNTILKMFKYDRKNQEYIYIKEDEEE